MQRLSCAIYTRKSTDEGLDQTFNSLEAQRESCLAYIESQKHEGWEIIPEYYDDGGYSGGTLERPAMKRLLIDIADGKVNVVVVYKVDRLTRSLTDFAKIVERFDSQEVSFVSVTQQFNTTSSMGRLTLNVLLSFAQFEREVTGERIRDKIAASKKKGMWMGGCLPYGYGVEQRLLYVIATQASHVRHIFERYQDLGSAGLVLDDIARIGILSANHKPFSKGGLYKLLQNPIYIGKIRHQGKLYQGQHEAIIPLSLWEAVQAKLAENRTDLGVKSPTPCLLIGKLFTDQNVALVGSTTKRRERRYSYYKTPLSVHPKLNIAAGDLENLLVECLDRHIEDKQDPYFDAVWPDLSPAQKINKIVKRVVIEPNKIKIQLMGEFEDTLTTDYLFYKGGPYSGIKTPIIKLKPHESRKRILLECLLQGFIWRRQAMNEGVPINQIARNEKIDRRYVAQMIYATFLSPKIISQILNGKTELGITRQSLLTDKSYIWNEQQGYRADTFLTDSGY